MDEKKEESEVREEREREKKIYKITKEKERQRFTQMCGNEVIRQRSEY